jgi:hypothetical protein
MSYYQLFSGNRSRNYSTKLEASVRSSLAGSDRHQSPAVHAPRCEQDVLTPPDDESDKDKQSNIQSQSGGSGSQEESASKNSVYTYHSLDGRREYLYDMNGR